MALIIKQGTLFSRFARKVSRAAGHPMTFGFSILVIIAWAATGPLFHFSDTWQLVINTGTTVITFLMVFLIQNTQNRDAQAIQLKLDELIRATQGAHVALLDMEELSDAELEDFRARYLLLAQVAREKLKHGRKDTGTPEIDMQADQKLAEKERSKEQNEKRLPLRRKPLQSGD